MVGSVLQESSLKHLIFVNHCHLFEKNLDFLEGCESRLMYVFVAVSDNLIDLSCEGTAPGPLRCEPEYVNDAVIRQKQLMDQRDPFDMRESLLWV